ncbi:MAG: hypothetical protein IJ551_11105 [Prevotella sp.]|nr:hypothetical protein [Prevotella sp.]
MMKLKHIYSLVAGTLLLLSACSPDDYSFGSGKSSVTKDDYSVAVNGNKVTFTSNVSGCTPLWVTPNGRSQEKQFTIELPFAGTYDYTFGIESRQGPVYGDSEQFVIQQNDFSLLSDVKYFYLGDKNCFSVEGMPSEEQIKAGLSKRWYPNDQDYGLGCTGPVMYMTPYDPTNTGDYTPEEEANAVYKDVPFGRANWAPNWDPGYQSWLIPADDPYMDSYMEFSMDAVNGCVAQMYRGESGAKGASTGTNMTGKYTLNLTDKDHPTISFSDCYAMHNQGFDAVCSNYTSDIIIAELTPYYLCLITKRTNSEGNWYIVWNFVSEEVKNGTVTVPTDEKEGLDLAVPATPDMSKLTMDDIFTVSANGVDYIGGQVTYTVNEDLPYDWQWWDGSSQAWKSTLEATGYNTSWAPQPGDDVFANELVLSKNSDGTVGYEYGDESGTVTLDAENGTLTFDKGITFLTVSGDMRTVKAEGTTFQIMSMDPAAGMTLGLPDTQDEKGNVNAYLVVTLDTKPISTATGPIAVALDTSELTEHEWQENSCFRLGFHHYGEGGTGIFKDAASVKVPKGKSIKVTFTIKDPSAWSAAPKCALIDNNIKTTWEQGCFELDDAVTVNLNGTTTVSLLNNTSKSQTFTATCLDLSIQLNGYYIDYAEGVCPDIIDNITCVIE